MQQNYLFSLKTERRDNVVANKFSYTTRHDKLRSRRWLCIMQTEKRLGENFHFDKEFYLCKLRKEPAFSTRSQLFENEAIYLFKFSVPDFVVTIRFK